MIDDLWQSFRPYVDVRTRSGRLGVFAVLCYLVMSTASVAFGLSGKAIRAENDLTAQISWDESSDRGYRTMLVTNQSSDHWTGVRLILDERYYFLTETVPAGLSIAVRPQDLHDGYILPRAEGLYAYEIVFPEALDIDHTVPISYRPQRIRLTTDQGEIIIGETEE